MQKIDKIGSAALIFDQINFAVIERTEKTSPLQNGNLIQPSKSPVLSEFRSVGWSTSSQPTVGFFIASVMDTLDNGLESVSFHVKTGHHQPHDARLANLVKVSHNFSILSGIQNRMRNRINPSYALGTCNT